MMSSPTRRLVQVQAPSDLPEGYEFQALVAEDNGQEQVYAVTVPPGGVRQGETFVVEINVPSAAALSPPPPAPVDTSTRTVTEEYHSDGTRVVETRVTNPDGSITVTTTTTTPTGSNAGVPAAVSLSPPTPSCTTTTFIPPPASSSMQSPVGAVPVTKQWRRGLCEWTDVCCESPCWMSWCCYPIVLGQIMQRMGLSWYGTPSPNSSDTCKMVTIVYAILTVVLVVVSWGWDTWFLGGSVQGAGVSLYHNVWNVFYLLFLVVHVLTRVYMRRRYEIAPECCGSSPYSCSLSDCLIAWCCSCCSVIQMSRHTHDESFYPYDCQSPTGLPPDAPVIV